MYLVPSNNEQLISEKEKIKAYYATDLINNGADQDYLMGEMLGITAKRI